MLRRITVLLLFTISVLNVYSQTDNIIYLTDDLNNSYSIDKRVEIYNQLAFEYMLFDNNKSIKFAKLALDFNGDKLIEERIRSLLIIGFNELVINQSRISGKIEEANGLIAKFNIRSRELLAFSYFITGFSTISQKDQSKGFDLILKANNLYYKLDNQLMINLTKSALASLHISLRQYNKAARIMRETIDYYNKNNLKKYSILSKMKLGQIHELNKNYTDAEKLLLEAVDEANESYKILLPYITYTMMSYYINRQKPIKALNLYRKYIERTFHTTSPIEKRIIYKNLITIYTMLGDYPTAMKYSNIVLGQIEENSILKNVIYNQVAYLYIKLGYLEKAEDYLFDVWEDIKDNDYSTVMQENLKYIKQIYLLKEDYKELYNFANIHIAKIHNYYDSESYKNLLESEEEFQVNQKEYEINIMRSDQRFRIISLFTISFLFLLIIISVIIQLKTVKKDKQIFENMARTDYLTKLFNRRTFLEKVEEEEIRYLRSNFGYSIIITDVDNFKIFNDDYGHECGDDVLKIVSKTLRKTCRKQDTVARWGGEEFIILLPETDVVGAKVIANRLKEAIEGLELVFNDTKLKITMTFGVNNFSEELNIDQIVHYADLALLHGKKIGKNVVVAYPDIKEETSS